MGTEVQVNGQSVQQQDLQDDDPVYQEDTMTLMVA
jgi:hypothetical protein